MYKYNRSEILKKAHILKKQGYNFGDAQKIIWKGEHLKVKLHNGLTQFSYRKKDQSIRLATGTLNNIEHLLIGSNKFVSDIFTIRYFDLEKKEFRAAKVQNLLNI